jgi:hypothetical protein
VCNLEIFRRKILLFVILVNILFTLCFYRSNIAYSVPYQIEFNSYEYPSGSSNEGFIIIDSQTRYLPTDIYLEEGTHIIFYDPKDDFNFSHWQFIGVEAASPEGEYQNPTLISVSGPGVVNAFYTFGSQLNILLPSDLKNAIFTEVPIELRARVISNGKPVPDATVTFYVDADSVGYDKTDGEGYASTKFVPSKEKVYKWWAKAEKEDFATSSSDKLEFSFQKVKLDPPDDEIFSNLPIKFVTFVEFDGEPVEDARVSFFVDDEFVVSKLTQPNGYTSFSLDNVSVGVHSWYVSVGISRWGVIFSEIQNFTYAPVISVVLNEPRNFEVITDFTSTVKLRAQVTYEDEPLQGVKVSFFVKKNCIGSDVSDINGFASLDFSPPEEDKTYQWYVTASQKHLLNVTSKTWSFFYPLQPPYIEVDEIFTSRNRADIDSEQTIGFHLRWENGSDVRGSTIRITDDHVGVTDDSGWVTFSVSSSNVGKKVWEIIEIFCEGMGEFKHNNKSPEILWDRISIELSVERNRVDVGTTMVPKVSAFYEYDNAKFNGSFFYNTELFSEEVCEKTIKVNDMQDHQYNLSAFKSNEIKIIWDRVLLSLEIPNTRVEIGLEPDIKIDGIYEYDGKIFKGSVNYDGIPKQYFIGERFFNVVNISDSLYDLSLFESNNVSCVFDEIVVEQDISSSVPTQVKILTNIHYKSDDKPVSEAMVKVNGIGEYVSPGTYESIVYSFHPLPHLSTEIKLDEFKNKVVEQRILSTSNIMAESVLSIFILSLIIKSRYDFHKNRRYKGMNEFWGKLINSLKNEQLIRNWTIHSGYTGKRDFTAIYREDDYIECKVLNTKKSQKISREDFKTMYSNWENYVEKKLTRKELKGMIRYINYTISILHQYEKLM